jgi:type IV pilus assembly protein PilQ
VIPFSFSIAEVINNTLMNVDLQIAAQEIISKANVLAAPKVLTLNHVKATINQGTQIPYLKLSDLNVASTEFKDAVLELQVTPHITPDRKIRLEIMAKQDEPSAQQFQVGQSVVPGIDSRKINTELLVDDGNIIVIGGVLRRNDTEAVTATPGLWKIPILGRLFRIDNERKVRTELLIFISPKIVEAASPPAMG